MTHMVRNCQLLPAECHDPGLQYLLHDLLHGECPDGDQRVPRDVFSNTRLAPTVREGVAYLTIDTACENTVGGKTHLMMVARILEAKYKVKPVIHPEEESYRFGPGEPRVSTERWHVPIGIGGVPMVIKSSALEDGDPGQNKIPWLAGQGPPGKVPSLEDYSGVLWMTGKAYMDDRSPKETHIYNPEDDPYATGDITSRTPCTLHGDVWEYLLEHPQVYVRHHHRPRTTRFHPHEVADGPEPRELLPLRVTYKHGVDDWETSVEEESWTGYYTVLFGHGCDPSMKIDNLPSPGPRAAVLIDVHGHQVAVHPRSLKQLEQKRFLRSFDLDNKPPDLPLNKQPKIFRPQLGEFGSDQPPRSPHHAHGPQFQASSCAVWWWSRSRLWRRRHYGSWNIVHQP